MDLLHLGTVLAITFAVTFSLVAGVMTFVSRTEARRRRKRALRLVKQARRGRAGERRRTMSDSARAA